MIPIVGETLQRELETGERLYVEQVIYKPSTNRYLLEDPDGLYRMYGYTQIKSGMNGVNSVSGWNIGTNTIEFKNGDKITYKLPRLIISGMIHGTRSQAFYNHSVFKDEANGIVCDLQYNPWDDNTYTSSLKNALGWGAWSRKDDGWPVKRQDDCIIKIYHESKPDEILLEGRGGWLSYLKFGDEVVWRIDEEEIPQWKNYSEEQPDGTKILPSDMRHRKDLCQLIEKEPEQAEQEKLLMEHVQRTDQKKRVEAINRRKQKQ